MQPIPRFWDKVTDAVTNADGERWRLIIWGWSTASMTHAREVANQRLADMTHWLVTRGGWPGGYYPRTPLREETLQEVFGADGTLLAAITRNRYGAEVLNTDHVLIADVDLPYQRQVFVQAGGLLRRLFGRGSTPPPPDDHELVALNRIEAFGAAHPAYGTHVYRTAAGLRVILTGTAAAPGSLEATQILKDLAADPVYVTLCTTHKTYRARLTPKPWRCGSPRITIGWPYTNVARQAATEGWIQDYRERSRHYAVCRLIGRSGATPAADEGRILDVHDQATLRSTSLPLA